MRKHNGMRPHDLAILLKILAYGEKNWSQKEVAQDLFLSFSEVSESLNRSSIASLIDQEKKNVNRQNLLEFLLYGVKYVFPIQLGLMIKGLPTAHSHPFMAEHFGSSNPYVWPDLQGKVVGQMVEPLYLKQTEAAKNDPVFYKLMALVDVIRIGKVREQKIAVDELKKMMLTHESPK